MASSDGVCECPEFVVKVLVAIARERGLQQPRLTFESGSNQGDGFIGVVTRVVIVDEEREIRLICKHLKRNPNDTESFTNMDFCRREIFIYRHVLPEIVRLQREAGVQEEEGFYAFPTCHFAEYNEATQEVALVFDDLRAQGFEMLEKAKVPDVSHVERLMRHLGRLHAASFALTEQKPDILRKFQCLDDLLSKFMQRKDTKLWAVKNNRLLQTVLKPEEEHLKEFFKRWETSMWADVADLIRSENAEPYAVINHGDTWINNLMFKSPTKMCMLDWQQARYASPVLDIVYFFFTCTDKPFRDQHFRSCLDIYYESLAQLLKRLGGDATKQFPKTIMEEHLKKFGKLGMAMCTFTTPLDTKYIAGYNDEPEHTFVEANKSRYEERMRGNIADFVNFGFMN